MKDETLLTADRILLAAGELFDKQGFHAVSMKNIANAANVSEMTVFRHFSSKKQVLEAVIKRMTYVPSLKEVFKDKLCWELEADLLLISQTYQKMMKENQFAFLITLREEKTVPEISEFVRQGPPQFKAFLMEYFQTMQEKGYIVTENTEAMVLAFMAVNFGYFFFKVRGHEMVEVEDQEYLKTALSIFSKGIKR